MLFHGPEGPTQNGTKEATNKDCLEAPLRGHMLRHFSNPKQCTCAQTLEHEACTQGPIKMSSVYECGLSLRQLRQTASKKGLQVFRPV